MRYQDYITNATNKAAEEAFRYALAVPADKAEWVPLDSCRSVLDQCRELAKCPVWAYGLISGEGVPDFGNEEAMAKEKAEQASWTTIAQCHEICKENLAKLGELYKSLPDEKLAETKWLPFDGGRDFTVEEMMDYPRWNYTYHLGQIAQIQMLYGDKEMH